MGELLSFTHKTVMHQTRISAAEVVERIPAQLRTYLSHFPAARDGVLSGNLRHVLYYYYYFVHKAQHTNKDN